MEWKTFAAVPGEIQFLQRPTENPFATQKKKTRVKAWEVCHIHYGRLCVRRHSVAFVAMRQNLRGRNYG